ncbi:MAG: pilus assembly protein TadG-related protein [Pseudomonadota bacterium]
MKTTDQTTSRMSREEKIRQTMLLISRFRREEQGGMIIFSLYCFVLMLLIAGVAVDVMRFETDRTMLQNTLDSASLAATNMRQQRDPEALVRDFMQTRGYDPDRVQVTISNTTSGETETEDGTLLARSVKADYPLRVNTFFMPLIGITELGTTSSGTAQERVQNVDISLIVDISGSMRGSKLTALKSAAHDFFEEVIDEEAEEGIVSVSLIPYNHTVVLPDELHERLTTQATIQLNNDEIDEIYFDSNDVPYRGTATEYLYNHSMSRCVRWGADQMTTNDIANDFDDLRAVDPNELLDMMASYDPGSKSAGPGGSYNPPANGSNRRCDPTRSPILAYQTEVQPLKDHVTAMYADGWTAVDHGMKWGVALLDPVFRPLLADMITDGVRPAKLEDRPFDYGVADALKVVVLMTDGRNTDQFDIKPKYKRGPSRIWYSAEAAADEVVDEDGNVVDVTDRWIVDRDKDGEADRDKEWYDGYYVLMPDNGSSSRWMRAHKPWDDDDATGYREDELPDDARQMDFVELYSEFSENALAEWFRDDNIGDWSERQALRQSETVVINGGTADDRLNGEGNTLEGICDAAKYNGDIRVFTLAFGSGADLTEMRACATSHDDAYYADDGDSLSEAFSAIAGAITQLRLTQ